MSKRIELAKQYAEYARDRKIDEALALVTDDVTMTVPMMGTTSGKEAIRAALQRMPGGGGAGANISWSDPAEEGDTVTTVGTGGPFGPIKIALGFAADDKIKTIDIGMGG